MPPFVFILVFRAVPLEAQIILKSFLHSGIAERGQVELKASTLSIFLALCPGHITAPI